MIRWAPASVGCGMCFAALVWYVFFFPFSRVFCRLRGWDGYVWFGGCFDARTCYCNWIGLRL